MPPVSKRPLQAAKPVFLRQNVGDLTSASKGSDSWNLVGPRV